MSPKQFVIALLFLLICLAMPVHSQVRLAVYPPLSTVWSGNDTNGTPITITGALPPEWKENNDIVTVDGSYSNRIFVRGIGYPYRVSIRFDTPTLSSSNGRSIPVSSLKYIFTYVGGPGGGGDATGTKSLNLGTYVGFSTAWDLLYTSGAAEYPDPEQSAAERELQFKYAIQVPNDQQSGTYTGTIRYRIEETGAGTDFKEHTAQISVVIGSLFRLSADRGSADFEKMKPGETKDNVPVEGVIVLTSCNTGNPWYLKINNDSPLSSGPYVIPNTNLIWYGWSDGSGRWYGNGSDPISLVPMLLYSSGANESNNLPDGTKNHLKFKLTVPKGQPGGKYLSNIKLTLTE